MLTAILEREEFYNILSYSVKSTDMQTQNWARSLSENHQSLDGVGDNPNQSINQSISHWFILFCSQRL